MVDIAEINSIAVANISEVNGIAIANIASVIGVDWPAAGGGDRGVFIGGYTGSATSNVIEYITISTTGNSTYFGDLIAVAANLSSASNGGNQRAISMTANGTAQDIQYTTINTLGNSTYFGDGMPSGDSQTGSGSVSNNTNDRIVWMGGSGFNANRTNTISYVTATSLSNAIDFGDCLAALRSPAPYSNGTNERGLIGGGLYNTVV